MTALGGSRVLVTGAAGFLGANLVRALSARAVDVHAVVRPTSGLWRLEGCLPRTVLHRLDLRDFDRVLHVFRAIEPDFVIHAAASGRHPADPAGRLEGLATSVIGTANLLEAVRDTGVRRVVHVGSSLEYGRRRRPLRPDDRLDPVTPRGTAKAAASLVCRQHAREHPLVIVRPFSIYGPWEQPDRLIPTAARAVLDGRPIALTRSGVRRDFVFVDDVTEACLAAMTAAGIDGEEFNVGSGSQFSNEEVVALIQELCGRRVELRVGAHPGTPADSPHWVADIRRTRERLAWAPRHSLTSGLRKTLAWMRQRDHDRETDRDAV